MSLTLYFHPLASYCWKALVALYETGAPFEPRFIDLGKASDRQALADVWPLVKFPVLRDRARDETVPEATIIIEYLAQHYPGGSKLLPADPDRARETRLLDRVFDLHVEEPMQKIVGDRIRPADARDPHGVAAAHASLTAVYAFLEKRMAATSGDWATGETFTLADCAASPALYYADRVHPLGAEHPRLAAYLKRLLARPSFARVIDEAGPYFKFFPTA
jgi:glutathione S-transferase